MGSTSDAVVLDSDTLGQLNSAEAKLLLDTIDSLRTLGVGEIVDLPQIIVVGDESSGKSSVLEAISRVRFPVKGGICTRFATELVLRKTPHVSIDVRINFAKPDGIFSKHKEPEAFRRTGFDRDALPSIIEEAKEHMGIRDGSAKGFSKDVLRVEITGPDLYSLTLVDLPGFFHSPTATQSAEDLATVDQLVGSYMQQKNSIILAVVYATNQISVQKVLKEMEKHDPLRERTLGVITKPDLCQPGLSNEQSALHLARNNEPHKLSHGWHVLRNRSEDDSESSSESRDASEENFFRTSVWSSLPDTSLGVENLRKKLSKVLLSHIQRSLPLMIGQIETALGVRQDSLARLGKPRSSTEDLRSYLLDIADTFQRLSTDAVNGRYGDQFFGDIYDGERKLRARLRNLNRAFHFTLLKKGAMHEIKWEEDGDVESDGDNETPDYLEPYIELYKFPDPRPIDEDFLRSEVEALASTNQGREFPGLPTADLVLQLFKSQASPWQGIAQRHLELVTEFTKVFVEQLFSHVIGADEETVTSILRDLVDPFFQQRAVALELKLAEILRPYTGDYGLPLVTEFRENLSNRRLNRLAGRVTDLLDGVQLTGPDGKRVDKIKRRTIMNALLDEDVDDDEFGAEQVIDMMDTYYEISLRNFAENVVNLAVEGCLVSDLPGILTPRKVDQMTEKALKDLAAETEEVTAERAVLQREAGILRTGLERCQKHRPREMTALPWTFRTQAASKEANGNSSTPQQSTKTPSNAPSKTPPIFGAFSAPLPVQPKLNAGSTLFSKSAFKTPSTPVGGGLFPTSSNRSGPSKTASQSTRFSFKDSINTTSAIFGKGAGFDSSASTSGKRT